MKKKGEKLQRKFSKSLLFHLSCCGICRNCCLLCCCADKSHAKKPPVKTLSVSNHIVGLQCWWHKHTSLLFSANKADFFCNFFPVSSLASRDHFGLTHPSKEAVSFFFLFFYLCYWLIIMHINLSFCCSEAKQRREKAGLRRQISHKLVLSRCGVPCGCVIKCRSVVGAYLCQLGEPMNVLSYL